MNYNYDNEKLTIYLTGSIDSNNAENIGKEIEEIRSANNDGSLVLNAEELKYISSAGLRQILRLKKKEKDLKIVNVSSEIYDIFEMTGFSEMMEIQGQFRSFNKHEENHSRLLLFVFFSFKDFFRNFIYISRNIFCFNRSFV